MSASENESLSPKTISHDFAQPQIISGKFYNPKSFVNWLGIRIGPLLRFLFFSKNGTSLPDKPEHLDETLPVRKPTFGLKSALSMSWMGHATVFVNLESVQFLTDPIWSDRASPFSCLGPKRYRPPPCSIDELPEVHFAVISHNHYDHFDVKSVSELARRFPGMTWFVPKGLKSNVEPLVGVNKVYEMTWGESKTVKFNDTETTIWCVPAQHWSGRGIFDRNKSLWCGWCIIGPNKRFYYTGDTGFCHEEFEKIGNKLGPFDLAAIQIGCYAPRFMMSSQHVDLSESTQIHKLIKAKKSIGIHWGTYDMGSHEFYLEPRDHLPKFCEEAGIEPGRFTTINLGETWIVEDDLKNKNNNGTKETVETIIEGS